MYYVAPTSVAFARLRGHRSVGLGSAPVAKPYAMFGATAPSRTSPFKGPEDTLRSMSRAILGDRGERSVPVRQFCEWIVGGIEPKDYLSEILAVRNAFVQRSPWDPSTPLFRYMNDPRHVELVKDPERLVQEIASSGHATADCDEITAAEATCCLMLGREAELVALGFGEGELTHVGLRCKEPKSNTWIWMDTVAGPREREAAASSVEKVFWSLD
jgi:hypothetical protein